VWQRLMVYAHQNIDLKPIPGLDHPFVDPEVAAKAEEAAKKEADAAEAQAEAERPPVLSSRTTQTLRDMTKAFQAAPVLDAPTLPEALSAL
ncbi:MAG: penicillin-binding protein, partial [Mesorhizobium sp.]